MNNGRSNILKYLISSQNLNSWAQLLSLVCDLMLLPSNDGSVSSNPISNELVISTMGPEDI